LKRSPADGRKRVGQNGASHPWETVSGNLEAVVLAERGGRPEDERGGKDKLQKAIRRKVRLIILRGVHYREYDTFRKCRAAEKNIPHGSVLNTSSTLR